MWEAQMCLRGCGGTGGLEEDPVPVTAEASPVTSQVSSRTLKAGALSCPCSGALQRRVPSPALPCTPRGGDSLCPAFRRICRQHRNLELAAQG